MSLRERLYGYEDATPEEVAHLARIQSRYLREKVRYSLIFLACFAVFFSVAAGIITVVLPQQFQSTQDLIIGKMICLGILLIGFVVSYWVTLSIVRRTHPQAENVWLLKRIFCSRSPKEILDEFRQEKRDS